MTCTTTGGLWRSGSCYEIAIGPLIFLERNVDGRRAVEEDVETMEPDDPSNCAWTTDSTAVCCNNRSLLQYLQHGWIRLDGFWRMTIMAAPCGSLGAVGLHWSLWRCPPWNRQAESAAALNAHSVAACCSDGSVPKMIVDGYPEKWNMYVDTILNRHSHFERLTW